MFCLCSVSISLFMTSLKMALLFLYKTVPQIASLSAISIRVSAVTVLTTTLAPFVSKARIALHAATASIRRRLSRNRGRWRRSNDRCLQWSGCLTLPVQRLTAAQAVIAAFATDDRISTSIQQRSIQNLRPSIGTATGGSHQGNFPCFCRRSNHHHPQLQDLTRPKRCRQSPVGVTSPKHKGKTKGEVWRWRNSHLRT